MSLAFRASVAAALLCTLLALTFGAAPAAAADDRVVITGGTDVLPDQTVGDVIVIDGSVRIAGHATGDVVSISGPILITGRVDGDVAAVSDRMTLAPSAVVGGDLLYGDERPVVAPGADVGGKIDKKDWADLSSGWGWIGWAAWWVAESFSSLIAGLLLLALAPGVVRAAHRVARERLGVAAGWGVIIIIGLPIAAIVAFVTVIGIPFAVALALAFAALLLVAYATSAHVLGRRILRDGASPWLAFLAGWAILRVLALIPVAGFIVSFVAAVIGLGLLTVALWRARRPRTPAAPGPEQPSPVT